MIFKKQNKSKIFYRILVFECFMSLIDIILTRRSIRRYAKKEISKVELNKILETGRLAPSSSDRQPWHFIVVTDPEIKKKIAQTGDSLFIKDAPVIIVGCGLIGDDYTQKWGTTWAIIDTSIALQNMTIAAWAMGVGSCWIGDFSEDEVKALLGISDDWKIISLLALGYPAEQPKPRKSKPIEEIVSFNKFNHKNL